MTLKRNKTDYEQPLSAPRLSSNDHKLQRREFLMMTAATAAVGIAAAASAVEAFAATSETAGTASAIRPTTDAGWKELTEEEGRALLTDEQFAVLREEATERAFTSPLNEVTEKGTFHCAGCDLAVYPSDTKFKSGTGWPSFYAPISEDVIGTKRDFKLIFPRTEVHCARCEGHLGHIFDDGPDPTGKRHCLNGVALRFEAATA